MSRRRKKQYYVVIQGRQPGIYDKWYGEGGAAEQVENLSESVFKGFYTREEAVAWMREIGAEDLLDELGLVAEQRPVMRTQDEEKPSVVGTVDVQIYTDGAATGNPGPGGYGVVLLHPKGRKELSGGFRRTTNNRMELLACIMGLDALKYPCSVNLFSDSKYVVDAINEEWVQRWQEKGWYRTKSRRVANVDLWIQLLQRCEKHSMTFHWVQGHAGDELNERCDQLATEAAQQPDLPPDTAYEGGYTQLLSPSLGKKLPLFGEDE